LGCCSEAIDSIYRMDGVAHVKNKETVSRWHLAFHRNNEAFPNPHVIGMKTSLPPLLDQNPEVKQSIMEYAKQNLNDLSAKLYPENEYMFLFDHSCGHDRKRHDGLYVSNSMRKGFGGKQSVMRESKIESAEYLGQLGGLLSVGASQTMNCVPSDAGPYWMTEAEKHSNRKDRPSGKKIKRFRNNGDLLK
jgi:hypothetical protein